MAIAAPDAVRLSAETIAKEAAKTDWAAGFRVSMVGIQAKMDLEDLDTVTKLVLHGPNAGRAGNDVLDDAITSLITIQDEVKNRDVRTVIQARDPGALPVGVTLETLKMRAPGKDADIKKAAVEGLSEDFLGSNRDLPTFNADLDGLVFAGKIDRQTANEAVMKANEQMVAKVKDATTKYESGEVKTLEELERLRDSMVNPELQQALTERINQYRHSREIFSAPGMGTLTNRVINESLGTMNPPLRNIYRNVLTAAENQLALEDIASNSEIAAQRAETIAKTPDAWEHFLNRTRNIIHYGGPALLIALVVAGIGTGVGAAMASSGVAGASALAGLGIGAGVGAAAGGINWIMSGGYREWRKLDAAEARSQADLDKFESKAGQLRMNNETKQLDYLGLLAEVATRGEGIGRNLRTKEDYEKLRSELMIGSGLGPKREELNAAISTVFNSQFTDKKS
jgi:hypothetical protein